MSQLFKYTPHIIMVGLLLAGISFLSNGSIGFGPSQTSAIPFDHVSTEPAISAQDTTERDL